MRGLISCIRSALVVRLFGPLDLKGWCPDGGERSLHSRSTARTGPATAGCARVHVHRLRNGSCRRFRDIDVHPTGHPRMTSFDEAELRHWLVDYLVTNIGCSPNEVDFEASLKDLGVASRDAVVLSGELSELLDRPVSPVEFWQHPTINALARFLTGSEPDSDAEV